VLIELASHNGDIDRLLKKGYALRIDGTHLVVRDIPYLDASGKRQSGAIVAKLVFIDKVRVKQDDHQVYFAGSVPHGLDGKPIANLAGQPMTMPLVKTDVVVERSFSNKPANGFANFFEKIEHYAALISGPALGRFGGSPLTFRADTDLIKDSVFKFHDTLTSRAEIADLTPVFKDEVIAIIGLGGTGAHVLDFMVKTPVREIRGYDGDDFHVHNAYRAAGRLNEDELGLGKAEVYQSRYDNFRTGLKLQRKYIDRTSAEELQGVTFAFVCVDKGTARREIFDLLIGMKIDFIDVGMGLNRLKSTLTGTLRVTHYPPDRATSIRDMQLAEMVDDPDDLYRKNVQISELNALNACLAVVYYKQLRGFYDKDNAAYHVLLELGTLRVFQKADE
jgi:hypothetical protein